MSVRNSLLLLCLLGAYAGSCFSQTYLGVNFDQLPASNGCLIAPTTAPGSAPAIPALKTSGATFSGGQVLSYNDTFQSNNNVYATMSMCAGQQPAITITFDGPVSGLSMIVGDNWAGGETVTLTADTGEVLIASPASFQYGETETFLTSNIHQVTLALQGAWTASTPAGFFIDNLSFYLTEPVYFVDPVPSLMTGTGVVSDPETLATMGTLVRGVAADGAARVLLIAQTSAVGDTVTFSVINDKQGQSNSVQQDGGVTAVTGSLSQASQSVRVTSRDTSSGPEAFALYYPPPDFARGAQDDALASRTVTIQVNSAATGNAGASRALSILRPPVVLVHDLWGDPANWNRFTPFVNDSRFFVRRASYTGILGSEVTASIPTYQTANLSSAKESSLGLAYNTPVILNQVAQFIAEFRSTQNVAAVQAAVVVHGMGGDLARAMVQASNYPAPESFGQGTVNKLITIGTPHLGTPLAIALLRNENSCVREVMADAGKFSFSSATVNAANVSGGIGDLEGDGFGGGLSPALALIQQRSSESAETALIAGTTNGSNTNSLSVGVAALIRQVCAGNPLASSLTAQGWNGVIGGPGDAMAPQFSQLAGQLFGQGGSTFSGLIHSAGMEQLGFSPPGELDSNTPVSNAVINLLNTQIKSGAFQTLP